MITVNLHDPTDITASDEGSLWLAVRNDGGRVNLFFESDAERLAFAMAVLRACAKPGPTVYVVEKDAA